MLGYQCMPADELFSLAPVHLQTPIEKIVSRPGKKAICDFCGEEIMNEREIARESTTLCRACAGYAYYRRPQADEGILINRLRSTAPKLVMTFIEISQRQLT